MLDVVTHGSGVAGGQAPRGLAMSAPSLLELRGVTRSFTSGWGRSGTRTHALRDVSLELRRGEAVALVGESGSGKSTLARIVAQLDRLSGGEVRLDGVDVSQMDQREFRARVQLVFQDPFASLNPMRTVGAQVMAPLRQLRGLSAQAAQAEAAALLDDVGLSPGSAFLARRPDELSGGQRQRVAIARALAPRPDVLVADEPTSMLDVSLRGGILQLFARQKVERGLGLLLITHDLAAAQRVADRVLVLFRGQIVEGGPVADVIAAPVHPYTHALLRAATSLQPGLPASNEHAPTTHCAYAARCPHTFARCLNEPPELITLSTLSTSSDRTARCHLPSTTPTAAIRPALLSTRDPP